MALTKFKLVKTGKLKGLSVKGDFIPFDKIDDTLAEQLIGKTHVLERLVSALVVSTEPEAQEAATTPAKRITGK